MALHQSQGGREWRVNWVKGDDDDTETEESQEFIEFSLGLESQITHSERRLSLHSLHLTLLLNKLDYLVEAPLHYINYHLYFSAAVVVQRKKFNPALRM
jgi:hypothetical protein